MFKSPTTTGYGGAILPPHINSTGQLRIELWDTPEIPFYNPESYHYDVNIGSFFRRTSREEDWNDGIEDVVHMDGTDKIYYRGFVSDYDIENVPLGWLDAPYFARRLREGTPYTSDIIGNELSTSNSPFISVSKNINTAVNFMFFRQGRDEDEQNHQLRYGYIFIIRSRRAYPITELQPKHKRYFSKDDKLHTFGNSPWDEELIPTSIEPSELVGWIKINLIELRHPESVPYPDISNIHWFRNRESELDDNTKEKIQSDYEKIPRQIAKIRALHVTPFTDVTIVPPDVNKPPPLGGLIRPTKGGRIRKYYTYYQ